MSYIQIAIDGPAGAGKSTIAKKVSSLLDFTYLDTGAMYRALTYMILEKNIDFTDTNKLIEITKKTNIKYINNNIFVNEELLNEEIRSPKVSKNVSKIAMIPELRSILVDQQKKIAKDNNVVMDGRDIGTFVLPDAHLKIFLTASVQERAKRRYHELIQKGLNVDLHQIEQEIIDRDRMDTEREFSPLIKAEDAIEIDTTYLSIDEVVDYIIDIFSRKP